MHPRTIDKYKIVRLLGEGGMGQVYEAIDEPNGRRVAIKTLRAELANDGEMLARFRNEARALITVRHAGLVEVYETGSLPGGGAYIVMEYVHGQSLRRHVVMGLPPLDTSLRIAKQVASALAAVHSHGIVHRDLKPENIMLLSPLLGVGAGSEDPRLPGEAEPQIKVIDFGIAKVTTNTQRQTQVETRTGVIMGTPLYMAPEQCGGEGTISDRTDVYALGCLLYELSCGHPPFTGEVDSQIMGKHLFQTPLPLRQASPTVSADLELLVHAMLAKDPESRPAMALVASALQQLQAGKPLSQTATKMLRLAREAATVRYRDALTARLGHPGAGPSRWLVFGPLVALSLLLLVGFLIRRGDRRPADGSSSSAAPASLTQPGSATTSPATTNPPSNGPSPGPTSSEAASAKHAPAPATATRPRTAGSKKGGASRSTVARPMPPPAAPLPPPPAGNKSAPGSAVPPTGKKPTKNTDIELL